MRIHIILLTLVLAFGCQRNSPPADTQITSMQLIDRNGFTETISNKDRLKPYQELDFLSPQPYQKVMRVYGKNREGKTSSKISSYHANGQIAQLLEVVDGRANGAYREWYPNGHLKIEAQVIEGLADITELAQTSWVFDRASTIWDEEGLCIATIPYDKGLLHTPSIYYHSNGKIAQILPYDQGILHGEILSYSPDGALLEKIPYIQGKKQGRSVGYWNFDHLMYEEEYEGDLLMSASYYDSQGTLISSIQEGSGVQSQFSGLQLERKIHFEKGVPEGLVEEFRPDGTLHKTYILANGKKNGEEWEYYPGKTTPKLCINWHDDQMQGQIKTWYENGMMESQREFSQYKKQGLAFAWYKNGDLMLMEDYANDLIIKASYFKKGDKDPISRIESGKGTATLYTGDGVLIKKIAYEKGKPLLDSPDASL